MRTDIITVRKEISFAMSEAKSNPRLTPMTAAKKEKYREISNRGFFFVCSIHRRSVLFSFPDMITRIDNSDRLVLAKNEVWKKTPYVLEMSLMYWTLGPWLQLLLEHFLEAPNDQAFAFDLFFLLEFQDSPLFFGTDDLVFFPHPNGVHATVTRTGHDVSDFFEGVDFVGSQADFTTTWYALSILDKGRHSRTFTAEQSTTVTAKNVSQVYSPCKDEENLRSFVYLAVFCY